MSSPLQIKVGSRVSFPSAQGLSVTSGDPAILDFTTTGQHIFMAAKKPGDVKINVQAGFDLSAILDVSVVP